MLESINNSLLKIRSKIYAPLVKEKIEVMKYEIKGIGITEAIEVYKKEVQIRLKLETTILANICSWGRFIIVIIMWINFYSMWRQDLHCYSYQQAIKNEIKNRYCKENIDKLYNV
jgi:hypothetical protein